MTSPNAANKRNAKVEPDDGLLRQFVGYNMKRAYLQIRDDLTETLAPFGLRIGTFSALAVLVGKAGISQTQLAQTLNLKRSGVVVVVDELETAGILERAPVAGDRRRYSLRVTQAGQELWTKAQKAVQEHEANLFSAMSAQEVETLEALLQKAADSVGSKRAEVQS